MNLGVNPVDDAIDTLLDTQVSYERLAEELVGDERLKRRTRLFYELALWPTIVELSTVFRSNGLVYAFFKGAISDARYYDGHMIRPTSDIDVIVESASFDRVAAILEKIGAKRTLLDSKELSDVSHAMHWEVQTEVGPLIIDVHHTLFDAPPFKHRPLLSSDCEMMAYTDHEISILKPHIELTVLIANLMSDSCSGYRKLTVDLVASIKKDQYVVAASQKVAEEIGCRGWFDAVILVLLERYPRLRAWLDVEVTLKSHKKEMAALFMTEERPVWKRGIVLRIIGHDRPIRAVLRHQKMIWVYIQSWGNTVLRPRK